MKVSEAKLLIGKKVTWEYARDSIRGSSCVGTGTLTDIKGKNALIDGDWKWLPHLFNLKEKV